MIKFRSMVSDEKDQTFDQYKAAVPKRVVHEESAFLVVNMMRSVLTEGTGDMAGIRDMYRRRRDIFVDGTKKLGWDVTAPKAGLYIWYPVPKKGATSMQFAEEALNAGGKDTCALSDSVELPAGFDPAGAMVNINVGGAQASFTLDAKGKSHKMSGTGVQKLQMVKEGGKWLYSHQEVVSAKMKMDGKPFNQAQTTSPNKPAR